MKTRGFEVVSDYLNEDIPLPKRATEGSAGYDLASIEAVELKPGVVTFVKTGLKAYMKNDEVLQLYIRSSLATKHGVMLVNNVGIIDADYYNNANNEGHILIALYNLSSEVKKIEQGERIAQGIFMRYFKTDDDVTSQKRVGGFGSSNE